MAWAKELRKLTKPAFCTHSPCRWSPKCPRRNAAQPQRNVSELSYWVSGWIKREGKRAAYQALTYSSFWTDDYGHAKDLYSIDLYVLNGKQPSFSEGSGSIHSAHCCWSALWESRRLPVKEPRRTSGCTEPSANPSSALRASGETVKKESWARAGHTEITHSARKSLPSCVRNPKCRCQHGHAHTEGSREPFLWSLLGIPSVPVCFQSLSLHTSLLKRVLLHVHPP